MRADKKAKGDLMSELKEKAIIATPSLCPSGSRLVWGDGPLDAKVALVGEAPGDKEDKMGRPFVGPAGKLLDRELSEAGLERSSIWVTNAVKCRPTKESARGLSNRPPTPKEVQDWLGFLMEELDIIRPKIIICAGAHAAKALIRKDFAITKERGQWFEGPFGSKIIATFHPSYLLRQYGAGSKDAIEAFKADLEKVAEALQSNNE